MDLDDLLNTVSGVEREAIENLCERAGTWDADWSVLKAAGEMIAEKPRLPRVQPENLVEGRWYFCIRGAGDEEVEECAREAENGIGTDWYGDRNGCQNASEYLEKLKDIAISRGRELSAALKRVEELEEMLRLREMSGIDGKEPTDG